MPAQILKGKPVSDQYLVAVKENLLWAQQQKLTPPRLAIVKGTEARPDAKKFADFVASRCEREGVQQELIDANESNVEEVLAELNHNPQVTGTIVSHPFSPGTGPQSLDRKIMGLINPLKDVEALHPLWLGALDHHQIRANYQPREEAGFPKYVVPCTPKAIMYMMDHFELPVFDVVAGKGRKVVIINYSLIIGEPLFQMVKNRRGTGAVCDIYTSQVDLEEAVAGADILVVAAGKPGLIHGNQIKPGAAVFDLGWNVLEDDSVVGDIDYDSVMEKAAYVVPFKRGVGPVTTTMVMLNLTYLHKLQDYFRRGGEDPVLVPFAKDIGLCA